MSDETKIETVSTTGKVHPGGCWGYFLKTAPECGECLFAEKCKDVTARMLAGQSIAGITKPEVKTVEPKPAAPAPAPVVEPPAPKPVKATEKAPVAAAPKEAEPKAEPKVESAPAPAPEAPATPVVETSEEKLNFDVIISRRISGCTFDKKETDTTNVTTFKDANNKGVLIVGVAKETGNFKLKSRKGEVVLMKDAAETEFQEALDKLL